MLKSWIESVGKYERIEDVLAPRFPESLSDSLIGVFVVFVEENEGFAPRAELGRFILTACSPGFLEPSEDIGRLLAGTVSRNRAAG
jgi:hypothetical protein